MQLLQLCCSVLDILVPECICEPPGAFSSAVRQLLQICCSVLQLLQLCCSVLQLCCSVLSCRCCSSVAACCTSVAVCCHAAVAPLLLRVLGLALSCRTNSCCLCETVSLRLRLCLFTSAHGFSFPQGLTKDFPLLETLYGISIGQVPPSSLVDRAPTYY
jgi:hypothetical protein